MIFIIFCHIWHFLHIYMLNILDMFDIYIFHFSLILHIFIAVGGEGGWYQYICLTSLVKANDLINKWKAGQARAATPQVTSVQPGSSPKCVTNELPWCCWCCFCPVVAHAYLEGVEKSHWTCAIRLFDLIHFKICIQICRICKNINRICRNICRIYNEICIICKLMYRICNIICRIWSLIYKICTMICNIRN